jgi:glc operon protein GlcG
MRAANKFLGVMALGLAVHGAAQAQVAEKKSLTIEGAKRVIAGAVTEAKRLNAPGAVIAVVDEGGNLMALERLDGTFAAGATISAGKARTAVLFKRPTKVFEDIIKNGRTAMVALPDTFFTPLQGGVPITVEGQVVGGVGVSGAASAQQDEELAMAGANALASGSMGSSMGSGAMSGSSMMSAMMPVTYFDQNQVTAAFAKGVVLLDGTGRNYMVHASRREAAGQAEVHDKDTDIIYVLDGTATFVTGGAVVDGKTTAPDELRGASVRGGQTRQLRKGDVIVVPAGTPHWFQQVTNPFTYYVVKVR